ncbi:hypothetical protein [Allochromatium warmingii]|uniref:hypothetical protein n=1 Tax=Allochromatium warmingii TaxID=61595 RepID=UPI0015A5DB12|nr:hypothetical protein [Allochromatium warmingii]
MAKLQFGALPQGDETFGELDRLRESGATERQGLELGGSPRQPSADKSIEQVCSSYS